MLKVPDNLARKIEEPVLKLFDGNFGGEPNLKVHENSHAKRIEEIKKTIDCLLDIRLELSIKKLLSDVISRTELITIIDKAKNNAKDDVVKNEIDKVFGEYFINKDNAFTKESPVFTPGAMANLDAEIENKRLSLNEMEEIGNKDYEDTASEKGVSLIKTDSHFKGSKPLAEMQKND